MDVPTNYFSLLLSKDLTWILKKIFLHLDGSDYDNCLLVCTEWRYFFQDVLLKDWDSACVIAEKKFAFDLFHSAPVVELISYDKFMYEVVWIDIDGEDLLLHFNNRFVGRSSLLEWDSRRRTVRGIYQSSTTACYFVEYSWNKKLCVGTPWNMDSFIVWDRSTFEIIQTVTCTNTAGQNTKIASAKVFPNCVVALTEGHALRLFKVEQNQLVLVASVPEDANFNGRYFDVNSAYLVITSNHGALRLISIDRGEEVAAFPATMVPQVSRVKFHESRGDTTVLVGYSADRTKVVGCTVNPIVGIEMQTFQLGNDDFSNIYIVSANLYLFRGGSTVYGRKLKTLKIVPHNQEFLTSERTFAFIDSCHIADKGYLVLAYRQPYDEDSKIPAMECISMFDLNSPNVFLSERAFHVSHKIATKKLDFMQVTMTDHGIVYRTSNSADITVKHFLNSWPWDFPNIV